MSTLQDILKLVGNVQSQDELRTINQAVMRRRGEPGSCPAPIS